MRSENAAFERFRKFRDGVVPHLVALGWVQDPDGPRVSSPISPSHPRVRLHYKNPADGLYYGLKDAVRVSLGERPRRGGVAKLTERQKEAALRYLYDPGNAPSIVEDCPEFPVEDGYRRAVEHFVEGMRGGVGQ